MFRPLLGHPQALQENRSKSCLCEIDNNNNNNNNNNIYLLQLGCHPVAVVMLHVYKT